MLVYRVSAATDVELSWASQKPTVHAQGQSKAIVQRLQPCSHSAPQPLLGHSPMPYGNHSLTLHCSVSTLQCTCPSLEPTWRALAALACVPREEKA
jgi:hypothetical protein